MAFINAKSMQLFYCLLFLKTLKLQIDIAMLEGPQKVEKNTTLIWKFFYSYLGHWCTISNVAFKFFIIGDQQE
jgi:hypothetical protein